MPSDPFEAFFDGPPRRYLFDAISVALHEDGPDLASNALFSPDDTLTARLVARGDTVMAGLPLIPIILREALPEGESAQCVHECFAVDGDYVQAGTTLAVIRGGARRIHKAERVLLNFICRLSGIATLTAKYAEKLKGTGISLLDTRKTLPALRYPEKYAVLMGGGQNHRSTLADVLVLRASHTDIAGSIADAVARVREACEPCPPVEVACRTEDDVREAVACGADWIMFDNMKPDAIARALAQVPEGIITEACGGVNLDNIHEFAEAGRGGLTYIAVGRMTHSAPFALCGMRIFKENA